MKGSIISFTKIDIVQLKVDGEIKSELPTEDFLDRLKIAIENDVSKHQVSYDSDNGTYEIFHNGRRYKVFYGDKQVDKECHEIDIIQQLNELVELTDTQKRNQEYSGEVVEVKKRSLDEIVANGDDGIFYSEDDKVKYIEYFEKKIKNENIFEKPWDVITGDDSDAADWNYEGLMVPGGIVGVAGIILAIVTGNLWLLFGILACILDWMACAFLDEWSLFNFIAKLLVRIPQAGYFLIKNIVKKLSKKKRLNLIKKSVMESELSENISSKAPEKAARKVKEIDRTLKGESKETIIKIFNKLSMLKDEEIKGKFAVELDELIEKFKQIPKEEYNKGFSDVLYHLSFLDGEVSKEVKNELSTHIIDMDFEKTRKQVDSISEEVVTNKSRRA